MRAKEVWLVLGGFFGIALVLGVPFFVAYDPHWPRDEDGTRLPARAAASEDPVILLVLLGITAIGMGAMAYLHRTMRPRLVRGETVRDVVGAAKAAAAVLRYPGAGQEAAWQAAAGGLLGLKRHWPYEPGRIWVTLGSAGAEVVAERTFQRANTVGFSGGPERVRPMAVRGRALVTADGTVTVREAAVWMPSH